MKYLNFICYSLLLMLLFNTSSLHAAPPRTDHTTHTPLSLMPEPLSGSRDTFSLAATWWLPRLAGQPGFPEVLQIPAVGILSKTILIV